ncbi:MAG: MBL fold metallo-hydrolase [Ruminococcus sp.]|nr:MBL fold metallo-hydrolase [Ruminococcus sp.]
MKIIKMPSMGLFGVNAYIAVSDKGSGVLIDAPEGAEEILDRLRSENVRLKMILLTHGHCDHISSAARIARETGAEIYIHSADLKKLTNDRLNLTEYFSLPPTEPAENALTAEDGQVITLDEMDFEVLHTPGHTSGSVCYILGDNMFCGDTLFSGSIGRTDMPDGDSAVMRDTLDMLREFDPKTDYRLLPGHGDNSTMDTERKSNPFLRG